MKVLLIGRVRSLLVIVPTTIIVKILKSEDYGINLELRMQIVAKQD